MYNERKTSVNTSYTAHTRVGQGSAVEQQRGNRTLRHCIAGLCGSARGGVSSAEALSHWGQCRVLPCTAANPQLCKNTLPAQPAYYFGLWRDAHRKRQRPGPATGVRGSRSGEAVRVNVVCCRELHARRRVQCVVTATVAATAAATAAETAVAAGRWASWPHDSRATLRAPLCEQFLVLLRAEESSSGLSLRPHFRAYAMHPIPVHWTGASAVCGMACRRWPTPPTILKLPQKQATGADGWPLNCQLGSALAVAIKTQSCRLHC